MKDFQLPISQMTQPDQTQMGFCFSSLDQSLHPVLGLAPGVDPIGACRSVGIEAWVAAGINPGSAHE